MMPEQGEEAEGKPKPALVPQLRGQLRGQQPERGQEV